jgi:predicted ribonuclease toxin of YeeF-YezG toxin-antitoxin module
MANPNVMKQTTQPLTSVSSDVLHIPSVTKLTPEEVAKAVAHHNKHHKDKVGKGAQATKPGKKFK